MIALSYTCRRPQMPKAKTLEDAFLETLKDVYYAEKQARRSRRRRIMVAFPIGVAPRRLSRRRSSRRR